MKKFLWVLLFLGNGLISWAQLPVADFSADTTKGCAPLTVQFKNLSTGGGLSYKWTLGNGNYSTLKDPNAIYYQPGKYEVKLEITDSLSQRKEIVKVGYIVVFKNPSASFTGSPTKGCKPLSSAFTNNSSLGDGPIKSWIWDFGDGNTSTDSQPSHTYKTSGLFDVSLVIKDINQCESKYSRTDYIEAMETPEISISSDKSYYCKAPVQISFTDKSTNVSGSDSYLWDFGDGNTSTQKNPVYTYNKTGKFDVTLTITKPNGCKATKTFNAFINLGSLIPDFTANITKGCNPVTIDFTNLTSPVQQGLSFEWDFGDGGKSGSQHVKYEYKTPGNYTVKLKAAIDQNCKDEVSKTSFITIEAGPEPAMEVSDTIGCISLFGVYAENKSKNFSGVNWVADGTNVGNKNEVFHRFSGFGRHTLELRLTNAIGCKKSIIQDIVLEEPTVEITPSLFSGCSPLTVDFDAETTTFDSVVNYSWDFGNGVTLNAPPDSIITQTYVKDSVYKVKLEILTASGCKANHEIEIRVGLKTNPDFIQMKDTVCNNTTIKFTNISKPGKAKIDATRWLIGKDKPNEHFSTEYHGKLKTDHDSGWYNIMLITSYNGCDDSIQHDKQLFIAPPWAKLEADEMKECSSDSVIIRNTSTGADSVVWRVKTPGKAPKIIINKNQIVIYKSETGSVVELMAFNFQFNCIDTTETKIDFPTNTTEAIIMYNGNFCSPASINFDAYINGQNQYFWILGKDTFSGTQFKYTQNVPGKYKVLLWVKSLSSLCEDRDSMEFSITGPYVSGTFTGVSGCAPRPIVLKSNIDPSQYSELYWKVGTKKIPVTHTGNILDTLWHPGPGADGTYVISLIGVDSNGCQGVQDFAIRVDGTLGGELKVRKFADCQALSYIFQTIAPSNNLTDLSVSWTFGDGTGSTDYTNNKTFKGPGAYPVKLVITDPKGCISTYEKLIDIEKEKIHADFVADSVSSDCPPLFVQFRDISTSAGRNIVKWYWEFGDGSTSVEKNPSKLYLYAGKFSVKLMVENEMGCRDTLKVNDFILVNGPKGQYSFDKKEGCAPLTVQFSSTQLDAQSLNFDMGDGVVEKNKPAPTHIYSQPGRFIPLMVISDSFGCTYTMPPYDTIYVYPYPEVSFTYEGTCYGYPVNFKSGIANDTSVTSFTWIFNQGIQSDTLYEENPTYTFYPGLTPTVTLVAVNKAGCSGTYTAPISLKSIEANFEAASVFNCVGNQIRVRNTSTSDTSVTNISWKIDNLFYSGAEVILHPSNTGPLPIELIVQNVLGCSDTLDSDKIVIGDTIKPNAIDILRVTVNDDFTVQLDHKKAEIPDFYAYQYYRKESDYIIAGKEYNKDKLTFQEYGLNCLDQNYCYIMSIQNACGLISDTFNSNEHCTVESKATGGINHALVSWNPYKGWSDVLRYEVWRENPDMKGDYHFLGQTGPMETTYIDSNIVCHLTHFYKIRAVESNGNIQESFSDTCAASPIWINTVPPNELIRATVVNDKYISIDIDSSYHPKVPIAYYEIQKMGDNGAYGHLKYLDPSEFTADDRKVKVDDLSYFYRTRAIDVCDDTSSWYNFAKTILLHVDTTGEQRPFLKWSTYQGWTEGVDYYVLSILNPDGSFSALADTRAIDSSWIDLITDLNQRPEYCYKITGFRNITPGRPEVISESNVDCSPVFSRIFVPNAFTINQDQLNDLFGTPGIYIKEYQIRIYNRWGEQVFASSNMQEKWDGTYMGKPCQQDAYAVIIEAIGVDRVKHTHFGTITLLR